MMSQTSVITCSKHYSKALNLYSKFSQPFITLHPNKQFIQTNIDYIQDTMRRALYQISYQTNQFYMPLGNLSLKREIDRDGFPAINIVKKIANKN